MILRLFRFIVESTRSPGKRSVAVVWVYENDCDVAEIRVRKHLAARGWTILETVLTSIPTPPEIRQLAKFERSRYRTALSSGIYCSVAPPHEHRSR